MAYNNTDYADIIGNTGLQDFCGAKGKFKFIVLVRKGTEIATKLLALTPETWTDNFNSDKALRWFPLAELVNSEGTQEDPVFQEFDSGVSQFVRDGVKTAVMTLEEMGVYNKNELNKLNGKGWDVYLATDKHNILGWTSDGVKFQPYSTDYVRILPETDDSGSEVGNVSLSIKFADVNQFNRTQAMINPTTDSEAPSVWYPSIVWSGIKDLQAIVTNMTAIGCTLELKRFDGTPYSGADGVPADCHLSLAATPTVLIAVTSITETATAGIYTVVWASQSADDYLVGLVDQPLATTQGFETPVKATAAIV